MSTQRRSWFARLGRLALGFVLGVGTWLGVAIATSLPAGASKCSVTSVDIATQNQTGVPLTLNSASHGVTKDWCNYPGNPVAPHSVANMQVGDSLFETEVNVAYITPNLDTIAVTAAARYSGAVEARCVVVPNGNTPSPYKCSTTVRKESEDRGGIGTTHVAKVVFTVEHR